MIPKINTSFGEEVIKNKPEIDHSIRDKYSILFKYLDKNELISDDILALHHEKGNDFPNAKGLEENNFLISLLLERKFNHYHDSLYIIAQKIDLSVYSQEEIMELANKVDELSFWSGLLLKKAIDLSALDNIQKISFAEKLIKRSLIKNGYNNFSFKQNEAEMTDDEKNKLRLSYESLVSHGADEICTNIFNYLNLNDLSEDELLDLADRSHNSEIWRHVITKIYKQQKEKKTFSNDDRDRFYERVRLSINYGIQDTPKEFNDLEYRATSLYFTLYSYLKN